MVIGNGKQDDNLTQKQQWMCHISIEEAPISIYHAYSQANLAGEVIRQCHSDMIR